MSYRELYERCQTLEVPVSRKNLTPWVMELTGKPRPKVIFHGMNPKMIRGMFVTAENVSHPFAKHANGPGGAVVVIARDLNYCWKRLVQVKELMHYFDTPVQLVGTPEDLEALVSDLALRVPGTSEAANSEALALWRALGVLCPEAQRQEFLRERNVGAITDIEIAQFLKIPESYVPHLFRPNFRRYVGV